MAKGADLYAEKIITENSRVISAQILVDDATAETIPIPTETKLSGGKFAPPSKRDYESALEALELETTIDTVYVCDISDPEVCTRPRRCTLSEYELRQRAKTIRSKNWNWYCRKKRISGGYH